MKDDYIYELEEKYFNFLDSYGISKKQSRFSRSFHVFKTSLASDEYKQTKVIPKKYLGEFRQALFDLTELYDIFQSIRGERDSPIIKDKLKKLNSGTHAHSQERKENTIARNTQFELVMYGELKKSGVNATLENPNPDILIKSRNHNFAIECKRIFSDSDYKVQDAVGDARDQLTCFFERDKKGVGIIAIDISRALTKGTLMLESATSQTAKEFISKEMELRRNLLAKYWTAKRLKDQRIIYVLIHATVIARLSNPNLHTHIGYSLVDTVHITSYSQLLAQDAMRTIFEPLNKLASQLS